jgi:hypothetical protein
MKLKLNVTRHTTASELIILGAFFESLALAREGHVVSVPTEDAGDDPTPADTVVVQVPPTGEDKPKRSRRSKAEIEAEKLVAAEAEAQVEQAVAPDAPTEPEQVPAIETPAPTPDVQPQVTPQSETASAEPASESPSDGKTYAAADVQQLATVVARTHGADLVKGKIAELGGTRIADLKQEQLNALGTFLAGVK